MPFTGFAVRRTAQEMHRFRPKVAVVFWGCCPKGSCSPPRFPPSGHCQCPGPLGENSFSFDGFTCGGFNNPNRSAWGSADPRGITVRRQDQLGRGSWKDKGSEAQSASNWAFKKPQFISALRGVKFFVVNAYFYFSLGGRSR